MSGAVRNTQKWLSGRFNPKQASEEAGITWIVKLGMLSDRLQAITEMSFDETVASEVDSFINWSAQTWESAIPYLQTKDDTRMHRKVLAYLKQHSRFLGLKSRVDNNLETRKLLLEEIALAPQDFNVKEALAGRLEDVIENEFSEDYERDMTNEQFRRRTIKVDFLISRLPIELQGRINNYAISGTELCLQQRRRDMLRYSKLLIALSFGKNDVEPAPPIAISKPEIQQRMAMPPAFRDSRQMQGLQNSLQQLEYYASRNKSRGD